MIKAEVRKLEVNMNSMFESSSQDHRRLALDCSNGEEHGLFILMHVSVKEGGITMSTSSLPSFILIFKSFLSYLFG